MPTILAVVSFFPAAILSILCSPFLSGFLFSSLLLGQHTKEESTIVLDSEFLVAEDSQQRLYPRTQHMLPWEPALSEPWLPQTTAPSPPSSCHRPFWKAPLPVISWHLETQSSHHLLHQCVRSSGTLIKLSALSPPLNKNLYLLNCVRHHFRLLITISSIQCALIMHQAP